MRLLFDENLSRQLVTHVAEAGLLESPDAAVWDYAKAKNLAKVTTDSDFFELATTLGPPPKVIWLRRWTYRTKDVEAVLRREAIRIAEFASDPELGLLVLDKE